MESPKETLSLKHGNQESRTDIEETKSEDLKDKKDPEMTIPMKHLRSYEQALLDLTS